MTDVTMSILDFARRFFTGEKSMEGRGNNGGFRRVEDLPVLISRRDNSMELGEFHRLFSHQYLVTGSNPEARAESAPNFTDDPASELRQFRERDLCIPRHVYKKKYSVFETTIA